MCGIAGVLRFEDGSSPITEPYLVRMSDAMRHRGPDGAGVWISPDGRAGFSHRRLAIIDPECAAQPMTNEDGSLWIVYNGEIYNHAEIRRELEALGTHRWATDHSDTEVILHAFEEWGIDCVHRFRGMFAFALWSERARALWLVRDRIGIKPLYWTRHHNNRLTFASEIKALLQDPEQPRAIDEEALYHYLSFLTTPAPQTLFAGIRKLPPATWMRVDAAGHIESRRYWDVWDHVNPLTSLSEGEIAERVLDELRTAVRYRKVSDVPVGVFLSGGIDSSTNAALFSEDEQSRVKTFSVAYRDTFPSYPSELPFAREMAARVGADHHEYLISKDDVIDFLPHMVHQQDEPIADPVCVPVYYVSKLARTNGVAVCQLGEGADELFIGYPSWKAALQREELDDLPVPRVAKRAAVGALAAAGYGATFQFECVRRASLGQPLFWSGAEAFTETEKQRLLGADVRGRLAGLSSYDVIRPVRERFERNAWERSHINWMSYADLNLRLPELLLMRVDKMSMAVSLEGRVPFLDHVFVALAMSIPSHMKLAGGELKHILKRAVRGLIPDRLIDRRKQGFGVPVNEMLPGPLVAVARREVAAFANATGLVDAAEADRVMTTADGAKVWYLMNLAMWWRHFIARQPIDIVPAAVRA